MALVSILMPIHNAAATLGRALRSILAQSFREWELIAVDDGSTDASRAILERAARKDPRIRTVSGPHVGLVEALRSAAAHARAPLLARMDADDLMHPRRLLLQVSRIDSPPAVDVLATRVRLFGPTAEGMRRYVRWQNSLLSHDEISRNLFVESPITHPSILMRRDVFERAGGYRDAGWAEDFDLWHRLRERGARFGKLEPKLLSWRDGPRRLTRTHKMYSDRAFHSAKLHYFLRHPLCRGPITVWGAGQIGRAWIRDLLAANLEVPHAIDIDPRKIGRLLASGRTRVVSVEEGLADRTSLILGAVGSRGAREKIRSRLIRTGRVEGRDYLFLA